MGEEEKKPEGNGEAGQEGQKTTGNVIPNDGNPMFFDNTDYWSRHPWIDQIFRQRELDKPGRFTFTYSPMNAAQQEESAKLLGALNEKLSVRTSIIPNPDNIPGAEPDPKVIQLMRDEMTKAFNAAVESTVYSGHPNPEPMTKASLENIIELMQETVKKHRENDPLLKRGIKEDWVCVLPPQFFSKITELAGSSPIIGFHPLFEIDRIMGRKTHVRTTVSGQIEYLSPDYYELIYGTDYRLKGEIIAKMQEEKRKKYSPEGENEE